MKNWSTDIKELEKNKEKYAIWKLEQMVNFGLDGEKINEKEFLNYLSKLNADSNRLKFLKMLTESFSGK